MTDTDYTVRDVEDPPLVIYHVVSFDRLSYHWLQLEMRESFVVAQCLGKLRIIYRAYWYRFVERYKGR